MARGKKTIPEQVVNMLRQIEVALANGKTTPLICKEAGSQSRRTTVGVRSMAGYRWTRRGG